MSNASTIPRYASRVPGRVTPIAANCLVTADRTSSAFSDSLKKLS